jgi:hypothetical protein
MQRPVVARYFLPAVVGAGFRRRAHVVIAACLAIAMEPTIARTQSPTAHCDAYANRAVRQMYIAADRACGVSGLKFSFNWYDHFNWCQSTQPWQHDIEERARAHELAQCAKAWCETYADRALMQAIENRTLGCGFSGARWAEDWDGHHRWCLASKGRNPDGPGREWQARNDEMNRCKAEKAPPRPPRPPKAGLLETHPTDASRGPSGVGTPKPSTPSHSAPPPFIVR